MKEPASPGNEFCRVQQAKSADELLESIRKSGVVASAVEPDLSDRAVIPELFDKAEAAVGPVEILVNNAAAWEADTIFPEDLELENKLVELWIARSRPITQFLRALPGDCAQPVPPVVETIARPQHRQC